MTAHQVSSVADDGAAGPARPVKGVRLTSLTGMRFIAAFMVFASHLYMAVWYTGGDFATDAVPGVAMRIAFTGVSFFFILSGFVLTWSTRPGDTAWTFWRRRLVKIYPNHFVTFLCTLVLLIVTGKQLIAAQIIPNLFLVQSWIPVNEIYASVNGVSWSLAVEAFLYLCFPLVYRLVNRIPAHLLWWCAGAAAVAVIALPAVVMAMTPDEPKWAGLPVTMFQLWFVYTLPATRLLEFVLGILLARIVLEGRRNPVRFWHGAVLVPVGYVVAMNVPYLFGVSASLVVPVAVLILAAAKADIAGTTSVLRSRIMVWLGDTSFALYMVHMQVLIYLYPLLEPDGVAGVPARIWYSVVLFAVSLTLAWLLYTFVEHPLMRRWGSARRPVPQSAVS